MPAPRLRSSVTVRVPATSANLGPGFDVLGLAVNVFNDVALSTVDARGVPVTSFLVTAEGEGAEWLPRDATNMCAVAVRLAFVEAGICAPRASGADCSAWDAPPVHLHLTNRIPIGAGLGSSSAAVVGGLLAGLTLARHAVAVAGAERLLNLACTVEGHADNVSAAIYGSLQIGVHTGERWFTTGVAVPAGLQCIFFIPDARQSTEGARAVLPTSVSRADAVFNLGRVALFVNAFASSCLDDLGLATQDALHQPPREALIPTLRPCVEAALAAGAKGAFLSGAGSAVMALTDGRKGDIHSQAAAERRDVGVARAMATAARTQCGAAGRVLVTQPTSLGAHVIEIDHDANAVIAGRGLLLELDDDGVLGPVVPRTRSLGAELAVAATRPSLSRVGLGGVPASAIDDALTGDAAWAASRAGIPSVRYVSTRAADDASASFTEVVFAGLAPDGGLFVPATLPSLPPVSALRTWAGLSYARVATRVLSLFVGDDVLPLRALSDLCEAAYDPKLWGAAGADVVPLVNIGGGLTIAELFHGPTAAFKDVALQFLGRLFGALMSRGAPGAPNSLTVLGATSGDTGSAAVAGLQGVPRVRVIILHPLGRVARVQALQMASVLNANVNVVSVSNAGSVVGGGGGGGASTTNFDDCQDAVKACFRDLPFARAHGLSAINSINWARVLAQTAYYVWIWLQWDAAARQRGETGGELTVVVPTGNFGNSLAAHYARAIGVPLKVHVATNANSVLHETLSTGTYAAPAAATPTLAPSMDISIASNFERYIHFAHAGTSGIGSASAVSADVRAWHAELNATRRIAGLPAPLRAAFQRDFSSSTSSDASIDETTRRVLREHGYAICPHTATGLDAALSHPELTAAASRNALVILATAHPAKFASGTPALAEADLYVTEVEGVRAARVVAVNAGAVDAAAAAFGAHANGVVRPPLTSTLKGLASKPTRVVNLQVEEGRALEDAVKELVKGLSSPLSS